MLDYGNIKFVVATTPKLIQGVHRLRYEVYVDEFHFEKAEDHPQGLEYDEWDPMSLHMAAVDELENVVGTIRLVLNSPHGLPTLHAVNPFYQDPHPASPRIAEVSRLAVARQFRRRVEDGFRGVEDLSADAPGARDLRSGGGGFNSQERRRQFAVILGLFKIMYHVSKRINLADWYMVSEKRLWYLLKRYHILFHPIGPEMEYHGVRIPYLGHISEIENHMLKVNQSLAESFIEGLDPSALEGKTTCPVPPSDIKPREVFETVPDIVWPYRISNPNPPEGDTATALPPASEWGLDAPS